LFWEDDHGITYSRVGNISSDTDTDGSLADSNVETIAMLVTAAEAENKVLSERIVLLEAAEASGRSTSDHLLLVKLVESNANYLSKCILSEVENEALSKRVTDLEAEISTLRLARLDL
jgi:hypothetical protein